MDKQCRQCGQAFQITDEDLEFYDRISPKLSGAEEGDRKFKIPSPTLCPPCRQQRMMIWRNETTLYKRKCDCCGKNMISVYSKDPTGRAGNPYKVYCQECFWSDKFNPLDFGRDYDFSRGFFEQFDELIKNTPLIALLNTKTENSEYCHRIYDGRNNYLSFIALYAPENLLYTYYTMTCKSCADVAWAQKCELCYELTDAENCYTCFYSNRVKNCDNSYFLEDCIGCSFCFGCKNLQQKKYCVFNEQKTRAEYEDFLEKAEMGSRKSVKSWKGKAREFFLKFPNKNVIQIGCENSVGANLYYCNNCYEVYDFYESENMRYSAMGEKSHNCLDVYGLGFTEHSYYSITNQYANHLLFCATSIESADLKYCFESYNNSSDCFGCVSMKKGKYCVLNKQYSKEDYEELVGRIVEQMKTRGEFGEFFSESISPFAYNETVAQDYFPLEKEEALQRGLKWRDEVGDSVEGDADFEVPDNISDVPDEIFEHQGDSALLRLCLKCEQSGKLYKIIPEELKFYKKLNIPIPRKCFEQRHKDRVDLRIPRKLWERKCEKCASEILASYESGRKEVVYCEECYKKEVYGEM